MRGLSGKVAGSGAALAVAFVAGHAEAQSAYNWTGFYVGLHGDYGWGSTHAEQAGTSKSNGIAAGLQAGYNWQFSSFLVGVEVDGTLSGISSKADPFFDGKNATLKSKQRWSATARLKAGMPLSDVPVVGNMLLYGTGGLAYSRWKTELQENAIGGNLQQSDAQNQFGWVLGAGVEVPLWDNVSARVEYLRTHYFRKNYDLVTDSSGKLGIDHDLNSVRLGINFRF